MATLSGHRWPQVFWQRVMKIFLTVGSMLPFDRLVKAVDAWAQNSPNMAVVAQIGETTLCPVHIEFKPMVTPVEYRKYCAASDLIISHVGMGTVITASELGKPLVMLARRPDLQEVTSNHQVATALWLRGRPGIHIAESEDELPDVIAESMGSVGVSNIETGTRDFLIGAIRQFISNYS